jgi:hypothetical protein
MKVKFGFGPNARWAGPSEIIKFRPVQTSTLGVPSQEIKHGKVVLLSGAELKND